MKINTEGNRRESWNSNPGLPLLYRYNVPLIILRWSVIFAAAVIYFTTAPDTESLVPPFIVLIILVSINLPITLYVYSRKPYRKTNISSIIFLDIMQGSLAVFFTGGYNSLFFVLYLLSFSEAGLFFDWRKAAFWITSIDIIQAAATTLHWTASRVEVSTYDLVSRFIRLLIVGLIVIIQGELLKREEESRRKTLKASKDLKKLNNILTKFESAGFDENKIFSILLSSVLAMTNTLYALIIFRTDASKNRWEVKATANPKLFPVGSTFYNLVHYRDETPVFRKQVYDPDKNPHFFKNGAKEVIGLNLAEYNEENKGLLIIGKNDKNLPVADENFFLNALTLEAQLVLHNMYSFQEKQEQIKKLAEFKDMQSTFFSAAGHEIKTPLTVLKTLHSTLELTLNNPTQTQEEIISTMGKNIDKLDNLTTDILETAKLESSSLELNKKEVYIDKLIDERIKSIMPLAEKKNQKINVEVLKSSAASDFPAAYGDKKRISEIISNILSNAIKFSPMGGMINIRLAEKSNKAELCIFDDGPLISKHDQEQIFNKYYSASYDKALTGFGLGLFIVKKLVNLHNGSIWIKEKEGRKGFCFTLPYYKGDEDE